MRTTIHAALERRYADLMRMAYLILDGSAIPQDALLAMARRAVRDTARTTLPRGDSPSDTADGAGSAYAGLRRALAARLIREPPCHRWTDRLRRRRSPPACGPCGPARAALRGLSPHERLVYVLCRLEGLSPPEVGAELGDHLLMSAYDVDRATAEVDARSGLDPVAQRAELLAFDPTLYRLRPPTEHSTLAKLAAAGVVALLTAAALVGFQEWRDSERPGDPVVVGDELWRQVDFPSIAAWPSQGDRTGDLDLLRRAGAEWSASRSDPPLGRVQVLFAGRLDGATYVIMHDNPGFRDNPVVAQYVERSGLRRVESIRRLGADTGLLILVNGTLRYLVPPWLTGLEAADPADHIPGWRPVPVQGGVTEPIPWNRYHSDCQNVVVFRMTHRAAGAPLPISQLAGNTAESATPQIAFRNPDPSRVDDAYSGGPGQWAATRAVTCEDAVSLARSADLRIGRLWHGRLPADGGHATLLTVDTDSGGGERGSAILVSDDGRLFARPGSAYATRSDTIAGAVWWGSERTRRWYLLAAATPGIVRIEVVGELGRHTSREGTGTPLLVQRGPAYRADAPPDDRPAVVQLIAYERDGTRLVIAP